MQKKKKRTSTARRRTPCTTPSSSVPYHPHRNSFSDACTRTTLPFHFFFSSLRTILYLPSPVSLLRPHSFTLSPPSPPSTTVVHHLRTTRALPPELSPASTPHTTPIFSFEPFSPVSIFHPHPCIFRHHSRPLSARRRFSHSLNHRHPKISLAHPTSHRIFSSASYTHHSSFSFPQLRSTVRSHIINCAPINTFFDHLPRPQTQPLLVPFYSADNQQTQRSLFSSLSHLFSILWFVLLFFFCFVSFFLFLFHIFIFLFTFIFLLLSHSLTSSL